MTGIIGLLFSGLTRYRVLKETSQPSCSKSCNELLGHLPDGNSIREVVDYIQDNINETEENEQDTYAYLGVTYDFRKGIWQNDFDGSPFNNSYWLVLRADC